MGELTFVEIMMAAQVVLLFLIFLSLNKGLIVKLLKIGKVFLRRLFGVALYNTVRLFPRNKNIVVFAAEGGSGFRGNPKYLFLKAIKEERLRCMWILKNRKAVQHVRNMGYECYHYQSLKGIYFQVRAKTFIHSHSPHDDFNRYLLGGATSINTWHGVGLKKVWGANKHTFTYKALHEKNPVLKFLKKFVVKTQLPKESYIISTSDRVSSYYPETFLIPKENVLQLGQARNDIFFQETEEDNELPEYIKNNNVITYMPTHRSFGKRDDDINDILDLKKIDAFCETYRYKFLVKRHMYSSGRISKKLRHVIDVSDANLDPQLLLKYTDILITDYSSCYTDYLLLDRPVIFYCYDLDKYLNVSNEMYFDYDEVTPGPHAEDFDSLLQALKHFADGHDGYQQERKRVLDIFYAKENQDKVTDKQITYIFNHILNLKTEQAANQEKITI